MWPFKKKCYSLIDSGLLQGMTDCHSHMLPGVDDGIQSEEDSLQAIHSLYERGIREFWLTPHIMEDIPNSPAELRKKFEALKASIKEPEIRDSIHLAAEHMLDSLFVRRLAKDDVLSFMQPNLHTPLLLVETSYFNPPFRLWELFEVIPMPDCIAFGGDLAGDAAWIGKSLDFLRTVPSGPRKFAVCGNWELSRRWLHAERWRKIFDEAGFQLLMNETAEACGIQFHGLDDAKEGDGLSREAAIPRSENVCILSHNPDTAAAMLLTDKLKGAPLILCLLLY